MIWLKFVYDISGDLVASNADGGGGVWLSSTEVILRNHVLNQMCSFSLLTQQHTPITSQKFAPDTYVSSENIVYDLGADDLLKVNLGTDEVTTINFSYSSYSYEDFSGRHLNGDGTKMVMGAYGIEHRPSGVYLMDIETSQIVRFR